MIIKLYYYSREHQSTLVTVQQTDYMQEHEHGVKFRMKEQHGSVLIPWNRVQEVQYDF